VQTLNSHLILLMRKTYSKY